MLCCGLVRFFRCKRQLLDSQINPKRERQGSEDAHSAFGEPAVAFERPAMQVEMGHGRDGKRQQNGERAERDHGRYAKRDFNAR